MTLPTYIDTELRWFDTGMADIVRSRVQWWPSEPLSVFITFGRAIDGRRRRLSIPREVLAYGGRPLRDNISVQVDGNNTRLLVDAPGGLVILTAYTGDILEYLVRTKQVIDMGAEWEHVDVDRAIAQCLAGAQ